MLMKYVLSHLDVAERLTEPISTMHPGSRSVGKRTGAAYGSA